MNSNGTLGGVKRSVFNTDLQADCEIDPAAERSADGAWMQTNVFEEFAE